MAIARSIQDVILGEAAYTGVKDITYADMMGIASVINNRAIALGVPADDVVSVQKEFNAYNSRLPAGVESYREMADQAWNDVITNGSITDATFYSTPAATKNLPTGLEQKAVVPGGHVYFSDPYERAINTKVGYRQPQEISAVRAQVEQRLATDAEFGGSIPTPASAPEQDGVAVADAATNPDGANVEAAGARMGERPVAIDPGRTAPLERAMSVINAEMAMSVADKIAEAEANAALSSPEVAASRFATPEKASRFASVDVDPARMAASPAVETAAIASGQFNPGLAALSVPEGLDPSFNEALMSAANPVVPNAVETTSYTDPNAALSSNLMSPVSLENVQAPAQDFAPTDKTVLGPESGLNTTDNRFVAPDVGQPTGVDSPEHQEMVAAVEKQLENPSITAPDPNAALSTPGISGPVDVASVTTDVTAPDPVTAAADAALSSVTPSSGALSRPALTAEDVAANYAAYGAGQITPEEAANRALAADVAAAKTARIGANVPVYEAAPALDTVEVADQPTIAAPVDDPNTVLSTPTVTAPALTEQVEQPAIQTSATNPMQSAADQALGTAMGVWNGQVQTGIATDGSTVSRLADGSVARYNPKFDQTEYTDDEGATWGGLVAGNQIPTAADPNAALSTPAANPISRSVSDVSPGGLFGGGILGKIVGLLSGLGSPTGVATAGTSGGMTTAEHGPAGAPGGQGPGGTGSSAGGYGTTGGKDPNGTY